MNGEYNMRRIFLAAVATAAIVSFANAQKATAMQEEAFVTAKPTDVITSSILNLDVTNANDESIGKIQDVVMGDGDVEGYIVSVGGFLGVGEKYVVVDPDAIEIVYSENDKKWSAKMNATKEQLEKAAEFKYEGRWAK
jgi:sporulation protein YlmC with PRC-barrel domain